MSQSLTGRDRLVVALEQIKFREEQIQAIAKQLEARPRHWQTIDSSAADAHAPIKLRVWTYCAIGHENDLRLIVSVFDSGSLTREHPVLVLQSGGDSFTAECKPVSANDMVGTFSLPGVSVDMLTNSRLSLAM